MNSISAHKASPPQVRGTEPVRFSAYLGALSAEIKRARSGEKTRLRLMASGTGLLEHIGFRELSVEDVCKDAGMAKGTFYIYFDSKDSFLLELCRRYVDFEAATSPSLGRNLKLFDRIRLMVEWYERTFALNVGILRCIVQMGEVNEEMRQLWHARNLLIVDRNMVDLFGDTLPSAEVTTLVRLTFRHAGSILDQSLFERYNVQLGPGRNDPDDPDFMIELHALLVFRAIYGRNPPAEALSSTAPLLNWPTAD